MKTINTSLGYPLHEQKDFWEIDLSDLKIFTGLSVLAKIIGEHIIDEFERSPGDIAFLYKINSNINPELVQMKTLYLQVYARSGVLVDLPNFREIFVNQLISVFGTIQRLKWRREIYPEYDTDSDQPEPSGRALIFPFQLVNTDREINYRFALERVKSVSETDSSFLRLTIETHPKEVPEKIIPSILVDDLATRVYIAGSTKISVSIRDNILNACSRGLDYYSEENRIYNNLFEQLANTILGRLETITFSWNEEFSGFIQNELPEKNLTLFKKLFLSLEAKSICNILHNGGTVKVKLRSCYFTLYLSQLGRALNISINMPRKIFHLNHYLKRMPNLNSLANQNDHALDFSNIKIFLVHHITSEVLGFIEALRKLGVSSIDVMFVKYSGIIPPAYLDALLESPIDFLFMAGLEKKTSGKTKDYYSIAEYFSAASEFAELNKVLKEEMLSYFEAMKLVAGHLFLKCCRQAEKEKKKVLLIEDGGYLAPVLNESALAGQTVKQVFSQFHQTTQEKKSSFSKWLQQTLIGTVEHTKNGFDRIQLVRKKYGKLCVPAFSIAVSDIKTKEESQEVAHSLLSAIESILHANGKVLSRRKIMVLGAAGNIGKPLCRMIQNGRLHEQNQSLARVDIQFKNNKLRSYVCLDDIPDSEFLDKDLFIGVIGSSILQKRHLEKLVLDGEEPYLFFASGSTKTVEFEDLLTWLHSLSEMPEPLIKNTPVTISYGRIIDPQSGIDQGKKVTIRFMKNGKPARKKLFLLADLSPINFLYYGVPTEVMDVILAQLLTVSLGMNHIYSNNREEYPPDLYAVDREIDEWGGKKI